MNVFKNYNYDQQSLWHLGNEMRVKAIFRRVFYDRPIRKFHLK